MTSIPTRGIQSFGAGYEDLIGRGVYVLLTGDASTSLDGSALRDSCGVCPIYVGGCPIYVGGQPVYASGMRPSVLGDDLWPLVRPLLNAS
jgi:hypothetical protein